MHRSAACWGRFQYTSKEDILLIVEPVLMAPLRREWAEIQVQAQDLARRRETAATRAVATRVQNELSSLILGFAQKLAGMRVLDPACGSENFLYVSLRLLLDLWKEVSIFGGQKRTLTNLYNERPGWLAAAHRKLDAAVFAAYGWPQELSDEEILARLLALNLERAGKAAGPESID